MLCRPLLFLLVAAAMVFPASANAAVTSTTVSTPANGSFLNYNSSADTKATISGTASGAAGGDRVDVLCDYPTLGTVASTVLAAGLSIVGGVWTTGEVSLGPMAESCDLRAVPAGTGPTGAALGPFAAIRVNTSSESSISSNGHTYDVSLTVPRNAGFADFFSFGTCGLNDMRVYGDVAGVRVGGEFLFYCNDYVEDRRITPPTEPARWMMMVDGVRAIAPGAEFTSTPGAADLSYSTSTDSATGIATLTETDPLLKCGTLSIPANPLSNCATYVSAGVSLVRTTTVAADGRTVRFVDTWTGTDAAPHAVDYWTQEDDRDVVGSTSFRLPGEAVYTVHAAGQVYPIAPGVATMFLRAKHDVVDNSVRFAQGAASWDIAPDKVWFNGETTSYFHHIVAVPAAGTVVLRRQYAMSDTLAQVSDFATTAEDLYIKPSVAITAPANGAGLTTTPVTVTGTAADNVGIASLTVNGVATSVTGGTFSTPVALVAGSNTITAVAKDVAGNTTSASVVVTYTAPVVIPPVIVPPVVTPPLQKVFNGTTANDLLVGNAADNILNGLAGDDRLFCGIGGKDVVNAGDGNDYVDCVEPFAQANGNRDSINCGRGTKDVAIVDPFDKVIGCEFVTRVWSGSATADTFRGTKAKDRFLGKGGNDKITCGGGIDSAFGGAGNDTINCADTGTPAARKKSRDGVNCGAGKKDVAIVDKYDSVVGCEKVVRR